MNETAKTFIIKILTNNLIHHEFQYVHGINVDIKKFIPKKAFNGLHFIEVNNIGLWLNYMSNLKYIAIVEILDDSIVYVGENKFKANNIYFNLITKCEIKDLELWNDAEFCKLAVKQMV